MYITALPYYLCAVFTTCFVYKGHGNQLINLPQLQLSYKRKGKPTTCLTNHKSPISHHIMPLVINNLGGGHTHTYRHCRQKQFQETSRAPAKGQHAPGLKISVKIHIFINSMGGWIIEY